MNVLIFYYFSIYWSDTSLPEKMPHDLLWQILENNILKINSPINVKSGVENLNRLFYYMDCHNTI